MGAKAPIPPEYRLSKEDETSEVKTTGKAD